MPDAVIGIEAGGTKFVMAWGDGPERLFDRTEIPTRTPNEALPEVLAYIEGIRSKVTISAIGAGVFGPLDLDQDSATYGCIAKTPKLPWQGFDMVRALQSATHLPIGFETDVNTAALAEGQWGSAKGLNDFIYMTCGTGIGCGAVSNGQALHGAMHPEVGHMRIAHDAEKDPFAGVCPTHGDCLEGLASGPAMKERWAVNSAKDLPADHPAWALQSQYIADALMNLTLILAPKRIILGGGVMRQKHLFPLIRQTFVKRLNRYVDYAALTDLESFIVPPQLGDDAGVLGALLVGQHALKPNPVNV